MSDVAASKSLFLYEAISDTAPDDVDVHPLIPGILGIVRRLLLLGFELKPTAERQVSINVVNVNLGVDELSDPWCELRVANV